MNPKNPQPVLFEMPSPNDLVQHDAATLRDDPIARANTASRANDICSLFSL